MGAISNLIPLIILFAVVGGGAFIGYQIYLWSNELADRAGKKMEKKNMAFTKEGGLRVGIKETSDENVGDKQQKSVASITPLPTNAWKERDEC